MESFVEVVFAVKAEIDAGRRISFMKLSIKVILGIEQIAPLLQLSSM